MKRFKFTFCCFAIVCLATPVFAKTYKGPKGINKSKLGKFYFPATSCQPTLSWKPRYKKKEVSYDLVLYTAIGDELPTPGFPVHFEKNLKELSFQIPHLLHSKTKYLWSVRSHLKDGTVSDWSKQSEGGIIAPKLKNVMYGFTTPQCEHDKHLPQFNEKQFIHKLLRGRHVRQDQILHYINDDQSVVIFRFYSYKFKSKHRKQYKNLKTSQELKAFAEKYGKIKKYKWASFNMIQERMTKEVPMLGGQDRMIFGGPAGRYYISSVQVGTYDYYRKKSLMKPLDLPKGKVLYGGDVILAFGSTYIESNPVGFREWIKSEYPGVPLNKIVQRKIYFTTHDEPDVTKELPNNEWILFY